MNDINDIVAQLLQDPAKKAELASLAQSSGVFDKPFIPNTGAQSQAYFSQADVLLYGGEAGGGKSGLGLGLALNEHKRSLVIRKQFTDVHGLVDDCKRIVGNNEGFVGGNRPLYRKPDGGIIHFEGYGDVNDINGKQGTPHDLIFIDEAMQLPLHAILLLMGWCRTVEPNQRCRVVLASNPPLDTMGDWVTDYFAPWLDKLHPNPAKDGELRYFITDEKGNDVEVKSKEDYILIGGEKYYPKSRTFIRAGVKDNPYIDDNYRNTLNSLPEPYRSALRDGNFLNARQDNPWQVIPTEWVRLAQKRWKERGKPANVPQCAIGVDIAQGGADKTVLAIRYDGYFDELIIVDGDKTPSGASVAALILQYRKGNPNIVIDMGGGYGGAAYEHLKDNNIEVKGHRGVEKSMGRTSDGLLKFVSKRSEVIWKFREALDPSQAGGSPIMLPDNSKLVSDLCSPTYSVTSNGIKIETKEELCKRLGRSPDAGDAVVMAWSAGLKQENIQGGWGAYKNARQNAVPRVNMGRDSMRRK
jgi:hypothetical protein